ncbi:METTL5 family protein [Natronobacterium gregoryi]|uniref:Methyltransferase domain-containing protein n=2 Tax=Natronobacterium gregoryi TaxID=44930 RepID=L0ABR8_NATGS|nr:METTL5 family protein [Natronobacterium gregoryi]AFZ71311.1 putative RNA methylase [Natronobacterium gregoryi SP2]ELY67200.1 methyltransferase small [Natronobacterium gregoryi SP2]PLK19181.1 methyltransferase domain-containing protein [Natronobacterium gregoryi SP2]SFJ58889.1 methyltransferase [Natronobacterium gregoryi]
MAPSRRTLARELESLADFPDPSPDLEQYLTPPEVAAHVCHLAGLQGDLERPVVDLGTGTGMLAIAASLAGADRVLGIDVDPDALARARDNAARVGSDIEWTVGDATRPPVASDESNVTVVANPPFGAQRGNRHADRAFLETARSIAAVSYTIHNEGSKEFVESYAADESGEVTHAFRAPFPIEKRFDFHTEKQATLEAEVFRIEWR